MPAGWCQPHCTGLQRERWARGLLMGHLQLGLPTASHLLRLLLWFVTHTTSPSRKQWCLEEAGDGFATTVQNLSQVTSQETISSQVNNPYINKIPKSSRPQVQVLQEQQTKDGCSWPCCTGILCALHNGQTGSHPVLHTHSTSMLLHLHHRAQGQPMGKKGLLARGKKA